MVGFELRDSLGETNFQFDETFLPILIDGKKDSGSSYFSVSLISSLFLSGRKILFFSALPEARNLFLDQCGAKKDEIYNLKDVAECLEASSFGAILLPSGNVDLLIQILESVEDADERIVFIKNIDSTLGAELFKEIENSELLVLAGDVEKSPLKHQIREKNYRTVIEFLPELEKYNARITSAAIQGTIKALK